MTKVPEKPGQELCIALLKQGDSNEFGRLVRLYQDMVFACCRAAGLRQDQIEDAAGETFLAAYQSIKRFDSKSRLSSWLWKIAYYKALDYRSKKQTKTISGNSTIETMESQAVSPEIHAAVREQNDAVWQAVKTLSQPQAAVIVLFYREDKSIENIGRILNLPENTVKTHLHRGRKELYRQLKAVMETEDVRK